MKRFKLAALSMALLSGCMVGPDYRRPEMAAPEKWRTRLPSGAAPEVQLKDWWKTFRDPILNRLIGEAITSNLDLKQTAARLRDARAQRTAAIAGALPSLNAKGSASRRFNNSSSSGQSGGGAATGGGFGIGNQTINIFQLGFDAQWELDLFGGVRRAVEVADASVQAEEENRRDVLVSLLGEVAHNYIELRANQQRLTVIRENLRSQQDTLTLTRVREAAGLSSTLQVAEAEAQLANTESQLPDFIAASDQAVHALGVLLGKEPGAFSHLLAGEGAVPVSSGITITDLPSELLRRRPDIRAAERQAAAATARIGVATAELYPKINLASFIGIQNMRITDFTPVGKSWSVASSLSMPIFNWGKLQANIESKEALRDQSVLTYQATVLNAFKEVEDALVAYNNERTRKNSLSQAVQANQLALQLAKEQYLKGLSAYLDVLVIQRTLLQTQSSLVESEAKVSQNLVALYKALGGGWEDERSSATKDG